MIAIDAPSADLAEIASKIPEAASLPAGTRVVVFTSPRRGWLARALAREVAPLHVIGSALLARGYRAIGGGTEDGRACTWGEATGA